MHDLLFVGIVSILVSLVGQMYYVAPFIVIVLFLDVRLLKSVSALLVDGFKIQT